MGHFRQVLTNLDDTGSPKSWMCVLCKETKSEVEDIHRHLNTHTELECVEKVELIIHLKFDVGELWKDGPSHSFMQDLNNDLTDHKTHGNTTRIRSIVQSTEASDILEDLDILQHDTNIIDYNSETYENIFTNCELNISDSNDVSKKDQRKRKSELDISKGEELLSKKSKSIFIDANTSNEKCSNEDDIVRNTKTGRPRRGTVKRNKTSKLKIKTSKLSQNVSTKEKTRRECGNESQLIFNEHIYNEEDPVQVKDNQPESNSVLGIMNNPEKSSNSLISVRCNSLIKEHDHPGISLNVSDQNYGEYSHISEKLDVCSISHNCDKRNQAQSKVSLLELEMTEHYASEYDDEIQQNFNEKCGDNNEAHSNLNETVEYDNKNQHHLNRINGKDVSKEKSYQCNECAYSTKYNSSFYRHQRIHSGKLKCNLCERKFAALCDLKLHIRCQHEKEFLFCDQCDKQFTTRHGLYEHIRHDHKQNYRYKCDHCDHKGFRNKSHLTGHMNRKHFKVKPYQCNPCGKTFTYKWHLKKHLENCNGPKMQPIDEGDNDVISCKYCEKMFTSKAILKVHISCKHEDSGYVCVCGKSYKWPASFSRHKVKCLKNKVKNLITDVI